MSSIHFASHPYWGALFWDHSPALYNLLLKFWIFLFSDSEISTRSLSALFSLIVTAAWLRVGYLIWGNRGSLIAGAMHAVLFLSVYYAREARMYSLFELGSSLLCMCLLLQYKRKPVPKWLWIFGLLVLCLSHYLSFIPLVLSAFWIFKFSSGQRKFAFGLLVISAIAAIAILLRIDSKFLGWMNVLFFHDHPIRWPLQMLIEIGGGIFGLLVMISLFIFSAFQNRKIATPFILAIVLAIVGSLLASFALQKGFFISRYFVFLSPWIVALLTVALLENKTVLSRIFLGLGFIFWSIQLQSSIKALDRTNTDWRSAARVVDEIPNARVLTTRPLSAQSPYFTKQGVVLETLTPRGETAWAEISDSLRLGKQPVILENQSGYNGYQGSLEAHLKKIGCTGERIFLQAFTQVSDIVIIKINCTKNQ